MTTIFPLRGPELPALHEAAKADGHAVIAATHIVKKDNEIVGYVSAGGIPTVLVWMDSKKTSVFDAKRVQAHYEDFYRFQGFTGILVPCMSNSPYFPFMEKNGHMKICDTTLFIKPLTE